MRNTLERAMMEPKPRVEGLHWAGDMKNRNTFNKKKDHLGSWTEVLFRS